MKRYDVSQKYGFHEMEPTDDGEWMRYSDHVEAMKRVAAAPVARGLTAADLEALRDAVDDLDCELSTRYQGYQQDDRRRARDFAVVTRARAILAQSSVTEPLQGTKESSASAQQAEPVTDSAGWADGWMQSGGLLYRLTDEHRPQNRDEINVTMANGSRKPEDCAARASQILALIAAPAPSQGTQEPVEFYTGGSFIRYVEIPAGFKMERISGDRWRVLAPSALPASPAMLQAAEHALAHAREWIGNKAHGDNCFVSAHYEGDPGDRCNCGKDAVLEAIDRVDFGESAAMSASKEGA